MGEIDARDAEDTVACTAALVEGPLYGCAFVDGLSLREAGVSCVL